LARTNKNLSIQKAVRPLLWRTTAFLAVFILFSGIIGPRIISSGILYKDGFGIYGGAGKALLFSAIAFLVLIRRTAPPKLRPWHTLNLVWLALAAVTLTYDWFIITNLVTGSHSLTTILQAHVLLLASIIFAAGGCFGPDAIRQIGRTYRRQLLIALGCGIAYFILLTAIYSLWIILSSVVLQAVRWLLHLSGLSAGIDPPRTLVLSKFSITVEKTCSGIESLALFSGLYALIGLVDWDRLRHNRLLLAFIPALLILFALNIVRVYGLIIAGYYINPQIAFSLFHTYAGMVFFIIYAGIFWGISYKWMLQKTGN
jgi:exosortase/archaeosortase family protein